MKCFFRKKLVLGTTLAVAALTMFAELGHATAKAPKAKAKGPMLFQTGGTGVFFPANLGVGDPKTQPTIVGDGSGFSAYNGTPTGNEFKLDGKLVGDGWDQHFGAAQTFTPGIAAGPGIILYPYKTASNPIRPGKNIHIMKTREGEVWFEYTGFFTLNLNKLTLISVSDFRIVGGTDKFAGATGDVAVVTQTDVTTITATGAPFRYDFLGVIQLRH